MAREKLADAERYRLMEWVGLVGSPAGLTEVELTECLSANGPGARTASGRCKAAN
ncbi:hypothetical protein [Thioclava dalianensis]|uniref:hypothetical protein n=1 Tax=Thioclava dalianensis TaxID=1185766 RepID=UPI000B132FE2|nr:hypothetical protein [Thioclava dalianensis]